MTLNLTNLEITAQWLEAGGDDQYTFAMHHFHCGTNLCIGGFASTLHSIFTPGLHCEALAKEALGLTQEQANALFYPDIASYDDVTAPQAAAVVRNLMKTGEVTWA